jgi:hypothetical protein
MPSEYKSNKFRFTRAKYCIPRKYYNKKRKKKKKIYISNKILYLFQCCLKNSLNQMQQITYPCLFDFYILPLIRGTANYFHLPLPLLLVSSSPSTLPLRWHALLPPGTACLGSNYRYRSKFQQHATRD